MTVSPHNKECGLPGSSESPHTRYHEQNRYLSYGGLMTSYWQKKKNPDQSKTQLNEERLELELANVRFTIEGTSLVWLCFAHNTHNCLHFLPRLLFWWWMKSCQVRWWARSDCHWDKSKIRLQGPPKVHKDQPHYSGWVWISIRCLVVAKARSKTHFSDSILLLVCLNDWIKDW